MRELFRHDVALGLLLQAVVADGLRGGDRFFHVALFEDVPFLIGIMRPNAGEEIGLEFQPHGKLVFGLVGAACGVSTRC